MKKIKEYLKIWWSEPFSRNLLFSLTFMFLIIIIVSFLKQQKSTEIISEKDPTTADTYIPSGFVLIPIELVNYDSIMGLIGEYGLVDLFTSKGTFQKGGEKVGSRLKLIRAPLNPQQFAVLVPDSETSKILQSEGPFFATVLNPKFEQKSELHTRKQKRNLIEYFN